MPIIKESPATEIIDVIPPPELHLLLGVVNKIFDKLQALYKKADLSWAKECGVSNVVTYGQRGFDGNGCNMLLKNVDRLRNPSYNIGCVPFADCLSKFRGVVDSCFGTKLKENYVPMIAEFRSSFLSLDINVTLKIHAVFWHIEYFCNVKKKALGYYSEQAMESAHDFFQKNFR